MIQSFFSNFVYLFVAFHCVISNFALADAEVDAQTITRLKKYSQKLRKRIGLVDSPNTPTRGSIAVLDSGLDPEHKYISKNVVQYVHFKNGRAHTKITRSDLRKSIDYTNGHGTCVVSAVKNVLPKASVKYFDVRSFSEFSKAVDIIIKDPNILVVNMSKVYARHRCCHKDFIRLAQAGKIIICSAGNSEEKKQNPAVLAELLNNPKTLGRIVVVGATKETPHGEKICNFSVQARHLEKHYITAPGEKILTACNNNRTGYRPTCQFVDGTSFAAPIVSAVVMKILSDNPYLSIDEAISVLKGNVKAENRDIYGCGQLKLNRL